MINNLRYLPTGCQKVVAVVEGHEMGHTLGVEEGHIQVADFAKGVVDLGLSIKNNNSHTAMKKKVTRIVTLMPQSWTKLVGTM